MHMLLSSKPIERARLRQLSVVNFVGYMFTGCAPVGDGQACQGAASNALSDSP